MNRYLVLLALIGVLTCAVAGCGATPEPGVSPPTQTPWILVVTATRGLESASQAQPTQTPWIVVVTATQTKQTTATPTQAKKGSATPTRAQKATAMATGSATMQPATTPQGQGPAAKATQTSLPPTATKPVVPTRAPAPGDIKYSAPVLLEPPTGTVVGWKKRPVLTWNPVGELAEDEYYCIQFDRTPRTEAQVPWGDWEYVKDPSYVFEEAFKRAFHLPEEQGEATVYWWVRVVRKTGEDENGKPVGVDISPPSEKWILLLEPKPAGA